MNNSRRNWQRSPFVPGVERLESRLALSTFAGGFEPRHVAGNHADFDAPPPRHDGFRPPRHEEYRFAPPTSRHSSPPASPPLYSSQSFSPQPFSAQPSPTSQVQYIQVATPAANRAAINTLPTSAPPATLSNQPAISANQTAPFASNLTNEPSSFRLSSVRSDRAPQLATISPRAVDEILVASAGVLTANDDSNSTSGEDVSATKSAERIEGSDSLSTSYAQRQAAERTDPRKRLRLTLDEIDEEQTPEEDLERYFARVWSLPALPEAEAEQAAHAAAFPLPRADAQPWLYLQFASPSQLPIGESSSDGSALATDELIELLALTSPLTLREGISISSSENSPALASLPEQLFEANMSRHQPFEILQANDVPQSLPSAVVYSQLPDEHTTEPATTD